MTMKPAHLTLLLCMLIAPLATLAQYDIDFAAERQRLIKRIEQNVKDTSIYLDKKALDPRVMEAIGHVPRHEFVPQEYQSLAYQNRPLPIGHGQTISQPYIVALMTDLLNLTPQSKVLEVGTGSGYQAAILAELASKVRTIEIIRPLGVEARQRLARLRYTNIEVRIGDGYYGWPEDAPYDAIVVTAAASHVPPPLLIQLKPGGRMVIPIGSRFMTQELLLVEKQSDGSINTKQILPVRFVPLTGKH